MAETEPCEVGVLFRERIIARLFAELLASHGATVRVVQELTELSHTPKLVTEAQYYHLLPAAQQAHCLVVGHPQQLQGISALTIQQPLTEEGIESALEKFLS